ncbi:MAG TPA: hypothetical protein VE825_12815 [Terriglobales bacterium]|jgi:hypothetical protein|nr:hypothetical protein [Terriglobales bacterium]
MSKPAKKLSEIVAEDLLVCPLCHGKGLAPRDEASRYLAENIGSGPGSPNPPSIDDKAAATTGTGGHAQQVRNYPSAEVLWRRSPKE